MTDDEDWGHALRNLRASIKHLEDSFRVLLGKCEPELIARIDADLAQPGLGLRDVAVEVQRAHDQVRSIYERICSEPLFRMVKGGLLSREQFHLMASRGLVHCTVPLAAGEATDVYDVFRMFHYEDDKWGGYINPDERPRKPGEGLRLRAGRPPEELPWAGLRVEQQRFFEKYLPDVASRFKRGD